MVHGQNAVVAGVSPSGEEPVGGEGAEGQHAGLVGLDDRRADDLLLLAAQEPAVAGVGVERQHGDAGLDDAEVLLERAAQRVEVGDDLLARDAGGDLRHGDVLGDQSHAQAVAAEDHHRVAFELGAEVFGVAREAEVVALHGLLVEGCRDERVEMPLLQVADRRAERLDGRAARLGGRLARLDGADRPARNEVHAAAARLVRRDDRMEVDRFGVGERRGVAGRGIGRAVDHGGAQLRDACVGQCLEDDLPADAVGVALRDAYAVYVL